MSRLHSVRRTIGRTALLMLICTGILLIGFFVYLFVCFVIGGILTYNKDLTTAQVSGVYACNEYGGIRGTLVMRSDGTFTQMMTLPDHSVRKTCGHWSFASWETRKRTVHFDRFLCPQRQGWVEVTDLTLSPEWFFLDLSIGTGEGGADFVKRRDPAR